MYICPVFFLPIFISLENKMNKEQFVKKICEVREKCSHNSARTHFLTLARVWRIVHGKDRRYKVEKLPKTSNWISPSLIKKLQSLELVPQRNLITSVVVYLYLTKANKKLQKQFSERMYEIVKDIKKNATPHERTEKQKKNWLTEREIADFWEEQLSEANVLLRKRYLSPKDKQIVQKAIIVGLHLGKGLQPGRLDWSTATWSKNSDGDNEDTLVFKKNGRWYVSIFGKTRRTYGQSTLVIHKPLSTLLGRWFAKTGTIGSRVFQTSKDTPFTHSTYGNYLKRIFHKKFSKNIGASLLRSIFISHKYKHLPKMLAEYEIDSRRMLHSSAESKKTYLKNQEQ